MEFLEVVEGRSSVRYFTDEAIPEADIRKIVTLGTRAPNAGNKQDWRCLVLTEDSKKHEIKSIVQEKLESLARQAGKENPERYRNRHGSILFAGAPVVMVFLTKPYRSAIDDLLKENGYSEAEIDYLRMRPDIQTISAMIQNILLAAYQMGYGTCWMVAPNIARHEIENYLGIRPPWSMAAIVALGRPSNVPGRSKRKPLDEVIEFIS